MNKEDDVSQTNLGKDSDKDKKKQDLKKRLKQYSLRIINLYESLPKNGAVHIITHQLVRSGTSPGAQYYGRVGQNQTPTLSAKLKGRYKN